MIAIRRITEAHPPDSAFIQQFEFNTPVIQFYESQGFRVIARTNGDANEAKMPDVRMEWGPEKDQDDFSSSQNSS